MLDTYHFDRMVLHDIAVTQDCQRMLCVGTLMASRDGLHPSKSRAEKQIIGTSTSCYQAYASHILCTAFNLEKKDIEKSVSIECAFFFFSYPRLQPCACSARCT